MALLDPILNPLLALDPLVLLIGCAFCITLVISLIIKFTVDQSRVKYLRGETKKLQKELRDKKLQEDKAKFEQKSKQLNMLMAEMMKSNFKPMLYYMLPVLLIFAWLSAHLVYMPIAPGEFFTVNVHTAPSFTGAVTFNHDELYIENGNNKTPEDGLLSWRVRGEKEGRYILPFSTENQLAEKAVKITERQEYENPIKNFEEGPIEKIEVIQPRLRPLGDISIFGWKPGWLGVYIFLSVVLGLVIRKLLGVH